MTASHVEIRLLAPEDIDLLCSADDDVFDFAVRRDYARAFLAEPHSLIAVAVDNGCIVGMASAFTYRHPDKPLQMFINEVGVAKRCHRRGIGRLLIAKILAAGKARGVAEAWVATEVDNAPARALYESTGGREDAAQAVVYVYDVASGDGQAG
ncbi:MAG TPA: GNAT family N-acetyltransferase [Woeseiaceae bacterium]|nr:GNAT family N-acetyltransferase [Woeseiaceae bacterium]